MLTAAAVCPHPPLLIPSVTGGSTGTGDAGLTELRDACHVAVSALLATSPDLLVVVGAGPATCEFAPDTAGSLADFGVPFKTGDGDPVLPLSLTVAHWLLARATRPATAGVHPAVAARLHSVDSAARPADCLALGAELSAQAPRVAILAMGDGPGRRARNAPGAIDGAADRYDELVAKALATGDLPVLAGLDPAAADVLFVAGRAAWQVLAGAASPGIEYASTLHYAAAPFEVSYYVSSLVLERFMITKHFGPYSSQNVS